jgi:hypothetical protein
MWYVCLRRPRSHNFNNRTGHWMCGFFPGVLWQLHTLTGKPLWAQKAQLWQQRIANNQRDFATQHDFGAWCQCCRAWRDSWPGCARACPAHTTWPAAAPHSPTAPLARIRAATLHHTRPAPRVPLCTAAARLQASSTCPPLRTATA